MQAQFPQLNQDIVEITPAELKRRLDDGERFTLLDTRRPDDFEAWQLTHPNLRAVNVPFTEFIDDDGTPAETVPAGVPDERLVVSCGKGISSRFVTEYLVREGWDALALADGMEGWARLHEPRELTHTTAGLDVVQYHRPSSGCLSYLLYSGGEAVVIDPLRAFTTQYVRDARERGARLTYALDTHVHADHISGVREVAEESDALALLPAGATERGLAYDAQLLEAGETRAFGDHEIDVIALPGHTTEMLGYRVGDVFVTGDTIFLESVARPDLEDADAARDAAATLWDTLQTLRELPEELIIAPAHVSPTTAPGGDGAFTASLGSLLTSHTVFDESQDEFVERVVENLPPRPPNFEEIIEVNLGRETADSTEAFELELGPNNCAASE